jgi:hypothetical protein
METQVEHAPQFLEVVLRIDCSFGCGLPAFIEILFSSSMTDMQFRIPGYLEPSAGVVLRTIQV